MAGKRGALELVEIGSNRVVVVVRGPEWTGDVGRPVGRVSLRVFLLWESWGRESQM